MSFSVQAWAFEPSSAAVLSPSHLREFPGAANGAAKNCVCVAFYENGRCPYGNRCEHAHHFSELTQSTQTKLLGGIPVESIPAHFFSSTNVREDVQTDAAGSMPLNVYSHYSPTKSAAAERTVPTRRRTLDKDRRLVVSHIGPQIVTPDTASVSSRTSSNAESQHLNMGAALTSKGFSSSPTHPATTTTSNFDAASFKMHLPLHCRYPHRSIPGTYYDVLALPRDASHTDIIAKYRAWRKDGFKRMRLVDPVGAEVVDRMIVESRNVLGNPVLRAAYDQQLPSVDVKQQPWSTSVFGTVGSGASGVGTMSTITTPSKRCTQGQSSTTSSTSEAHNRVESLSARMGYGSNSHSIYQADIAVPVVTISSTHSAEGI
ncbi:hypothetical protein ABL78_4299 [Leptomonas seymouri]|uniref:C3H1-type domain-containing protein n=1 Tax=Leptomonas seymouri TaxID=5684 RepID=A0A0N1I3P9_LEPSE|nr:hypothetical protein ABL78_4299 [Leptomonas seymouri]|eukprot:KPI86621.1 hypothetical protein ABL78_4299 [Leptomonas seymouri]